MVDPSAEADVLCLKKCACLMTIASINDMLNEGSGSFPLKMLQIAE